MERNATLLEAAELLRKAASMLESLATDRDDKGSAPRVRNVREKIRSLLSGGAELGSAEIADALYSGEFGIDKGTWKRRVIVTLSSMHKKDKTIKMVLREESPKWKLVETETGAEAPETVQPPGGATDPDMISGG